MNSRAAFVIVGLGVNALILARGIILMMVLDYADLGFVALVQAGITFAGLLHFGLLNGGYRLLCHAGPRTGQRIVDLAYTGFAVIGCGLVVAGLGLSCVLADPLALPIVAFSILGGVASLMRSWVMNEMVAGQRLGASNAVNLGSSALSFALLLLLLPDDPPISPALVAVSAIVIQPAAFVIIALASGAGRRPRALRFSRLLGKIILRAGFSLFVAGLALQTIPLIERAYIGRTLGLETLGRLYLAYLFVTLFQMVPNLVQNVFLAPIVANWRARDMAAIRRELQSFLRIILAYCAVVALALWLLAEPLVALVLPRYLADLRWVYLIAPGLIAFTIAGPFTLSFNVLLDYRWFLIAYSAGAALSALVFALAAAWGHALDLDQIAGLRSAGLAMMGALLAFGSWRSGARAPEFRLFGAARRIA